VIIVLKAQIVSRAGIRRNVGDFSDMAVIAN
jgi:hypothetical protein